MISTGQGCCVSEAGEAGGAQPQAGGGGGQAGVQVSRVRVHAQNIVQTDTPGTWVPILNMCRNSKLKLIQSQ